MTRARSKPQRESYLSNFLGLPTRIILLFILFVVILFPFYWLVTSAFKLEQEYYADPPVMIPSKLTMQNFVDVVYKYELIKGLINSILIASGATVLTVFFGSLASYSLTNGMLPKRTRGVFAGWFLVQKMYPAIVVAVPVFYIIRTLRLMDNIMALVIMNTSFNLPLVILLMIGFYQEIPYEVEEQSMLDGCTLPQRYFYVTTPMVKSGLIATGMLTLCSAGTSFSTRSSSPCTSRSPLP